MTNFLTKERRLSPTVKILIGLIFVLGFFYPSVYATFQWLFAREPTYQSHSIHLPFLWTQKLEGRTVSWERPRAHAFTPFAYRVNVIDTPTVSTPRLDLWHTLFGTWSDSELKAAPQIANLLRAGMICGAERFGQLNNKPDSVIAFGCLAKDRMQTFTYTGPASGVGSAISIILQAQQ
jgi:hypothetical protein